MLSAALLIGYATIDQRASGPLLRANEPTALLTWTTTRTAGLEQRGEGLEDSGRADHVGGEYALQVLDGCVGGRSLLAGDACIVDQDVERANLGAEQRDRCVH
jgi:hypothetical protein